MMSFDPEESGGVVDEVGQCHAFARKMPIRFADNADADNIVDLWLISIIRLTGNVIRNNIPHFPR